MQDKEQTQSQLNQEIQQLRDELEQAKASIARLETEATSSPQLANLIDLPESEERYRLLTDNIPGLYSVIRPDHTYAYVNLAFSKTFGRPRS
ncbi:PAS domain-containing protein [Myxococcota bacterium]|nr:PAS domain-containing protein [Myxococcota bacterium]